MNVLEIIKTPKAVGVEPKRKNPIQYKSQPNSSNIDHSSKAFTHHFDESVLHHKSNDEKKEGIK